MIRDRLRLLAQTQEGRYIPREYRAWFWREFKRIRAAYPDWPFRQAWDALVWQLEREYEEVTV